MFIDKESRRGGRGDWGRQRRMPLVLEVSGQDEAHANPAC
jgi:hypothetical protein